MGAGRAEEQRVGRAGRLRNRGLLHLSGAAPSPTGDSASAVQLHLTRRPQGGHRKGTHTRTVSGTQTAEMGPLTWAQVAAGWAGAGQGSRGAAGWGGAGA